MKIQVQEGLFDPWHEVAAYQRTHLPAGKHGGTVVFVGTMRDFNDGYEGIDEPIVLVAVWSEHRAMAFDACRFIINDLKSRAPFWKREATPEGERWVEHNTQDPNAA